jgi:hypothetical protein
VNLEMVAGGCPPRCSLFESAGEFFEGVDGGLRVLADFDDVAVGIAHVAMPFVAVIVERLGEEAGARSKLVSEFRAGRKE